MASMVETAQTPLPWWKEPTRDQWRAWVAAWLPRPAACLRPVRPSAIPTAGCGTNSNSRYPLTLGSPRAAMVPCRQHTGRTFVR